MCGCARSVGAALARDQQSGKQTIPPADRRPGGSEREIRTSSGPYVGARGSRNPPVPIPPQAWQRPAESG